MENKKVHKEIGSHSSTIIALYMNYLTDTQVEIVTMDEDGIIKMHRPDGSIYKLDLSKYGIFCCENRGCEFKKKCVG